MLIINFPMEDYLGVPVKGPTSLCGYNLGMIIYCNNQVLELKNEHVAI